MRRFHPANTVEDRLEKRTKELKKDLRKEHRSGRSCRRNWRLSASLGLIKGPLKLVGALQHYRIVGFKATSKLSPHFAERSYSLSYNVYVIFSSHL